MKPTCHAQVHLCAVCVARQARSWYDGGASGHRQRTGVAALWCKCSGAVQLHVLKVERAWRQQRGSALWASKPGDTLSPGLLAHRSCHPNYVSAYICTTVGHAFVLRITNSVRVVRHGTYFTILLRPDPSKTLTHDLLPACPASSQTQASRSGAKLKRGERRLIVLGRIGALTM